LPDQTRNPRRLAHGDIDRILARLRDDLAGPTQSFCIPARIFPDYAALHAFMTAVHARIKSARQTSTADRPLSHGESERA
jgi:hypothetical protein